MQKALLGAVAVFAVLLVAVLVARGGDEKVGIKELKLPSIAAADVVKVEVSGKHQAVLERSGDAWTVADPKDPAKKHAADATAVKGALDALSELKAGDYVSSRKEKATELEVDDDNGLRAKLTTARGEALDVVFGKTAKGGGSYARLGGGEDVFIVKGRLGAALKKDVAGWRKRQLVELKAEDVAQVTVKPATGPAWTIVAQAPPAAAADGGVAAPTKATWQLADAALPPGFRVDEEALGRVPQSIATLRAADFAPDGTTDEAAGLAGPHTVVEAVRKDGTKVVLRFGAEDDKKRVYTRAEGDPQLYLVGSYQAKQVGKALDELRDTTLLPPGTQADQVQRIVVKAGKDRVVVERKDGAFALVEPKTPPAGFVFDPAAAQSQASQIARLRAARLVAEKATPDMGLANAGPVVELTTTDGKTHAIKFGAAIPEEKAATTDGGAPPPKAGPAKEHYVQGTADGFVYAIGRFPKERYEKPLDLFKKVDRPAAGPGGGMAGLENLPPEVRKKLEASLKKGPPPAQ